MKTQIKLALTALALVVMVAACEDDRADLVLIDSDPTVTIDGINSGLVEGDNFSISLSFNDGLEGSSISTLASVDWNITSGGASVVSGSEELTGDNDEVTITSSPLPAGNHLFNATVFDSNGNSATATTEVNVVSALPDITGTWVMKPVQGALKVGPASGSGEWWGVPLAEVTGVRDCFFDDEWTFNSDGTFTIAMQGATFLEAWQGGGDSCGTPIAPFDGSGSYTYTFDGTNFVVNGIGAYIGLPKVTNLGELGNHVASDAYPSRVTYEVASVSETDMELRIAFDADGNGFMVHWTYLLEKK